MGVPKIAAVGFGVVVAIGAVFGIAVLLIRVTRDSPADHARKEAQAFFERTATVMSCTQVGSDEEARIYRCRIVAPGCVRTHRFVVYRDRLYGAAPYSVSADVDERPCRYPSD